MSVIFNSLDIDSLLSPSQNGSYKTNLNSTSVRLGFIKKVYGILSFQLLATAIIVYCVYNSQYLTFLVNNNVTLIISAITTIIISLVFFFSRETARKVPINYILLGVFTLAESFLVASSCVGLESRVVLMALFLTAFATLSLTCYAMTTKQDISFFGGLIFVLSFASFISGIFMFFYYSYIYHILVLSLGIVIYSVYIIYDTQLIVGGKRLELSSDDYIVGAMMLYVDIIILFLKILRLIYILTQDEKREEKKKN